MSNYHNFKWLFFNFKLKTNNKYQIQIVNKKNKNFRSMSSKLIFIHSLTTKKKKLNSNILEFNQWLKFYYIII